MHKRRDFIEKSTLVGAGIMMVPNTSFGITNGKTTDKLRIGMIG